MVPSETPECPDSATESQPFANQLLAPATTLAPDRNPALVYLAQFGKGSLRTMRGALDRVAALVSGGRLDAALLPWADLRYQHTAAIRSALLQELAPASVNKHLSAVRGVLREAWRLGLLDAESYNRAVDLRSVRSERLPSGRMLSNGELLSLFEVCSRDASPSGPRDAALLAVMAGAGLRRSEVVGLAVDDFVSETGELRVIGGKGGKQRLVFTTNGATDAVHAWLRVRGPAPGPLFVPIRKGGALELRQLSAQAIYLILRARAEQASVRQFAPHDLRRTFISTALDRGADLPAIQRLAGHASVNTTARYDRRGEDAKRRAAEFVHVPYVRPLGRGS